MTARETLHALTVPVRALAAALRGWLNEPTPRKHMVPAYLMLTIGLTVAFVRIDEQSAQRAADAAEFARIAAYNQCVVRIETRDDLRSVLLGITGLFDSTDPGVQAIVDLIQSDYPSLPTSTCDDLTKATGALTP